MHHILLGVFSGQEEGLLTQMLTDSGLRVAQAIPRACLREAELRIDLESALLHPVLPVYNPL